MDLVLREDEREGWAVLSLAGELDLTTAPRLREQVVRTVVNGQPRVVLDLQDVEFVDSTGLGVLVGARRRADVLGVRVVLVNVPPRLHRLLAVTRLSRLFVYDNVITLPEQRVSV